MPTNYDGAGTVVTGYQDFFTGTSFNPGWSEYVGTSGAAAAGSSGNFTLPGDGTLHINGGNSDPNKLLYTGATYNSTQQNVLAMIEVTNAGPNSDGFRGGVAAETNTSDGQGIDELFRQNGNGGDPSGNLGNHVNLLNDAVAWGPSVGGANTWTTDTFYWVREITNGSSITGEIWPADGVTPESSAATANWTEGSRSGFAGLVADSNGGNGTFQVNFVLIQAPGLGSVIAGVPEPSSIVLFGLGLAGLALAGRRRRAAQRAAHDA